MLETLIGAVDKAERSAGIERMNPYEVWLLDGKPESFKKLLKATSPEEAAEMALINEPADVRVTAVVELDR